MIYLKKFENHAAYTAAESGLILPNVSLCEQENDVHYNPYDPYAGHDYVEIGGIKWATMNVGANSITDYGLYFQWGDTQGYTAEQVGTDKIFNWTNYKYSNGTSSPSATDMTKYNSIDGLTTLEPSDDAVTTAWGGSWRMPSIGNFLTLEYRTNTAWTNDYQSTGVRGVVCTDKTDSSKVLFFPAAGLCDGSMVYDKNHIVYYWARNLESTKLLAGRIYISSIQAAWNDERVRYSGFPVRGVIG